jgi:hypothetical protein
MRADARIGCIPASTTGRERNCGRFRKSLWLIDTLVPVWPAVVARPTSQPAAAVGAS